MADCQKTLKIASLELANPLVLAPLSGISDLPFRLLAKEQGCALVCTEMTSAEGIIRNWKATERLLRSCPEERPLAVQIFGSRPEAMAEAAKIVEGYGADLVDINMGCPVRKVVRGGSGAALLRDVERAKEIIQAVRKAISLPLTIKIRSGWDEKSMNFLEMARMAEGCGVNALTVHGRTRTQGYAVKADWEVIARVKARLRIPVIGNGDLTSPSAIPQFFRQTGCDGAMIGRGALGNPWIFRQALNMLQSKPPAEPSLEEKEALILRHLRMVVEMRGEDHGLKEFRKHLIWYTRGLRGNAQFRSQIPLWKSFSEVVGRIQEYFQNFKSSYLFS
ncbi:MAG: tRNA dihydrouridine synthase DusB [Deltaproteobacteria bacterium]|nr:tRNA dihydrouridine synthase DusB [Deltaproteobacteria bacterium]